MAHGGEESQEKNHLKLYFLCQTIPFVFASGCLWQTIFCSSYGLNSIIFLSHIGYLAAEFENKCDRLEDIVFLFSIMRRLYNSLRCKAMDHTPTSLYIPGPTLGMPLPCHISTTVC